MHNKRFVIIALIMNLSVWFFIFTDVFGILLMPVMREFISLIYLCFIPGATILGVLKYEGTREEGFLYSVGLSLFYLMIVSLLLNIIIPIFGLYNPISLFPLLITITALQILLCVVIYKNDANFDWLFYSPILKSTICK